MTPEERRAEIAREPQTALHGNRFLGGQMVEHFMRVSGDLLGGEYDDEGRKVAIQLASKFDGSSSTGRISTLQSRCDRRRA